MRKHIVEISTNVVIVLVIVCIVAVGIEGTLISAFGEQDIGAIYRGSTEGNNISLMINVYWGSEYIPEILAILDKYDVTVTFFVGGSWVASNSDCLATIVSYGHEIGSHGYFHKEQSQLDYQGNYDEIYNTHQLVYSLVGYNMTLFAPPSGDYSTVTLQCAYDLGYTTIMWSRDTIDWRDKDISLIYSRATKDITAGELILMHPTYHTVQALENILQYYQQNNYNVVTVSDNINGEQYGDYQDIC